MKMFRRGVRNWYKVPCFTLLTVLCCASVVLASVSPTSTDEPVTEIIELDEYPSTDENNESISTTALPTQNVPATVSGHSGTVDFPRDSYLTFCSCDLTSNACDINCCCDPDCHDHARRVFSKCIEVRTKYGPWNQRCQETRHFFRDNSNVMRTTAQSDSYFCLVYDNLNERHFYESVPVLNSESEIDKALGSDDRYSWTIEDAELPFRSVQMKEGAVLWIVTKSRNIIIPWKLPCAPLSNWCSGLCPVHYLVDHTWSCLRQPSLLTSACNANGFLSVQSYYKSFQILKLSDQGFNNTNLCSNNTCVSISLDSKQHISTPFSSAGICRNAVVSVKFYIEHSGINGIDNVRIVVKMAAVNISVPLLQHFQISYAWTNASDHAIRRSGNPGYVSGLPLLVGTKHIFTKNQTHIIQQVKTLTVVGANVDGSCDDDLSNRVTVNFKHNLYTSCKISLPLPSNRSCHYLRCFLQDLLVDAKIDHIASFGDPSSNQDWGKIQIINKIIAESSKTPGNVCLNVPNHLDVNILYVATHTVQNPQFKVIGAKFVFHSAPSVTLQRASEKSSIFIASLPISTSVSFHEIKQSPKWQFGRPPQIKVSVPSDFFYPFLTGTSSLCCFGSFYKFLIIVCLCHFIINTSNLM